MRPPLSFVLLLALAAAPNDHAVQQERSSNSSSRNDATATPPDAIVPFKIHVPAAVLVDLKQRLRRTRFPDEIPGTQWTQGSNLAYMKELVAYWLNEFDWRKRERRLNEFNQFKTDIDGVKIHFVHQRSKEQAAMPIVLIHGWPGSFVEFTKIFDPLLDPLRYGGRAEDAFHVVALSLPGYGFSDKPTEPGYSPQRLALVIAKLMARLGYTRYAIQGGDWGAIIGRLLAISDAPHVAGLHLNLCLAGPPLGTDPNSGVTPAELARMQTRQQEVADEHGYADVQSTKPQTVGYALNDSPAGLAAWIVQLFRRLCNCGDDIDSKFTKDEILTDVMIYWVTETATSSARLYYERRKSVESDVRV
jgi:pimeloyl-ACP methyl ester carboxylesterase